MNEEKEVFKLRAIKTDKVCFIKRINRYGQKISNLIINGEVPQPTQESDWFSVSRLPESVKVKIGPANENYRQELKAELLSEGGFSGATLGKLRPSIPRDDCMEYNDYESDWFWKKEYATISSLYELKWDVVEHEPKAIEFECEIFCEIPSLDAYSGMKYPTVGQYNSDYGKWKVEDKQITHRAVDKILFPSIMHPSCKAFMSSDCLYTVIRYHIKQNIDYRYATISSDYDFCLTVQKRIIKREDYDPSKDKPTNRQQARNKGVSLSTVFEATPKSQSYKRYTPLPQMHAKNNKALKRKIDKYLKDLMAYINEPVVVCEHCNGTGVNHIPAKFKHPDPQENQVTTKG